MNRLVPMNESLKYLMHMISPQKHCHQSPKPLRERHALTAGLLLLAPPSAFLTRRMVDQIRGIDLVVVLEDRYLQGYTGVQDVYQIP